MKLKNTLALITIFFLTISFGFAQDLRQGGSSFGRIESDGAVRIKGSIKGKFESNGDIRVSGSVKGKIESNGDIRKRGSVVGSAKGVEKERAAVIFFFDFFKID